MKANIYNQADYEGIWNRIESLGAANQRKWGKMTLPQMLEHCILQLKMGLGDVASEPEGSFFMRTNVGRWFILDLIPWPKGLPTPSKMNLVKNEVLVSDFQVHKHSLLQLLEQVKEGPDLGPHPFFGAMNRRYWGRLIWKHLDHHLRQFSA